MSFILCAWIASASAWAALEEAPLLSPLVPAKIEKIALSDPDALDPEVVAGRVPLTVTYLRKHSQSRIAVMTRDLPSRIISEHNNGQYIIVVALGDTPNVRHSDVLVRENVKIWLPTADIMGFRFTPIHSTRK